MEDEEQLPTKQFPSVRLLLRTPARDWRRVEGLLVLTHWHVHFYPVTASKDSALDLVASFASLLSVERRREGSELELLELVFKDSRAWLFQMLNDITSADCERHVLRYAAPRASLALCVPAFAHALPYDIERQSAHDGWSLARDAHVTDWRRLLTLCPSAVRARWSESVANASYALCSSYPRVLVLPASVAQDVRVLTLAAEHRDHARLPVLSWLHPRSGASLTRCAQPLPGFGNRRNEGDEAVVRACFEAQGTRAEQSRIVDARPYTNAVANRALKGGYEDKGAYFGIDVEFLGMENIHAVREAALRLQRLTRTHQANDTGFVRALDATQWLAHVHALLKGAQRIARFLHVEQRSVLVHCSHGWDRTAQLTALAQLLLDPYYRTLRGLGVLVEKEWCALGHQCSLRAGHVAGRHALQGAQHHDAQEAAPVFVLWVDALWQMARQHPSAFEFNERALLALVDEYYAGTCGTFLGDCEAERSALKVSEHTPSLWSTLLAPHRRALFLNPLYSPPAHAESAPPLEVAWSLDKLALWETLHLRQDYLLQPSPSVLLLELMTKALAQKDQALTDLERRLKAQGTPTPTPPPPTSSLTRAPDPNPAPITSTPTPITPTLSSTPANSNGGSSEAGTSAKS